VHLSNYVGNTPLIPIKFGEYTVWGKAEFMNPGGSVKDRMATYIINDAEANNKIKIGSVLCEATSGNTGIAFAMLAAERGYKMKIVMPSNMSIERKKMFEYYGAELIEVDEGDFDGAIELRDNLCKEHNWFNCNQFHNPLNILAHYNGTGIEIQKQWKNFTNPDAFILGTGTGGTLMGCGKRLKEYWNGMKIIAVEPFLVDLDFVDEVRTIKTDCAKTIAKYLATKKGLFVGISAGANVIAAFQWLIDNNKKHAITILCDRGERYFSCL
jgi:cysteine synthase A